MKILVLGDGGWGTALAMVLDRNGHDVTIWGAFPEVVEETRRTRENTRYLPGVAIPASIRWTSDRSEAADAGVWVAAAPSKYAGSVLESFAPVASGQPVIVSVAKGFDPATCRRLTEVASAAVPGARVAALSGPSHAEEVARGIPSAVVVASEDSGVSELLQALFNRREFRVYTSLDVVGVELGGAVKNVIAIAAGVADGIGYGDNTKAALITRGLAEIARLGMAMGAQPATFSGLSGMGDLVVTCMSRHSRNRGVGERLGRGESIDAILAGMVQVAEGVPTTATTLELAGRVGVPMPIVEQVQALLLQEKEPRQAVNDLLERDPKAEQEHASDF